MAQYSAHKIWESIFWKVLSCCCFASTNALVRYLSGGVILPRNLGLPIHEIMFYQNLVGMLVLGPFLWHSQRRLGQPIFYTRKPFLQFVRITSSAIGVGFFYLGLRYIPITEVVAISFVAPVFTILGSVLILKENLTYRRKSAIILSLTGGFLISRPDLGIASASHLGIYAILPLLAALIFSFDKLLTRKLLSEGETPESLAWYLLAFMCPLCLIPAIQQEWIFPQAIHWPAILLLGALSSLAHYSFSRAYSLAEITFLLPFGTSKILLSGLISYVVFAETPKTFDMWTGILVITASTIILGIKPEDTQSIVKPSQVANNSSA